MPFGFNRFGDGVYNFHGQIALANFAVESLFKRETQNFGEKQIHEQAEQDEHEDEEDDVDDGENDSHFFYFLSFFLS